MDNINRQDTSPTGKAGLLWRRLMTMLVLMTAIVTGAKAFEYENDNDAYFKASFDNDKGCFLITIRQGDDRYGPVLENGYVEDATLRYGSLTLLTLSGSDVGENKYKVVQQASTEKITYTHRRGDDHNRCLYLDIVWYPSKAMESADMTLKGTWDIKGIYGTETIDASRWVNVQKPTAITLASTEVNSATNQTIINFNSSDRTGLYSKGTYTLMRGTSAVTTCDANGGQMVINEILETTSNYTIKYEWKNPEGGAVYTSESEQITVNAYTKPRNMQLTYDDLDRVVNISWSMTAVAGSDVFQYPYRLERHSQNSGKWEVLTTTLPYDQSQNTVTYQDDYFKTANVTDVFTYRVRRQDNYATQANAWNDAVSTSASISVTTEHRDIITESVEAYYSADIADGRGGAVIEWEYNDNELWSTGSKFVISRYNLTSNSRDDIELQEEDLLKGRYEDEFINPCNKYYYTIRVVPGGNYAVQNAVATDYIILSEVADMVSLEASKGYYRDYVELRWEADFTDGFFDSFTVERKVHGESDDKYTSLEVVPTVESATEFVWKDETCVPGIIYDYRVYGVLACADERITSANKPVSVGYVSPKGDIYGRVTFESGQGVGDVMMRLTTDSNIGGTSRKFGGTDADYIETDENLTQTTAAYTMQASVAPSASGATGILLKKGGYELGLSGGKPYFKAGTKTISSEVELEAGKFATVAAVYQDNGGNDSIFIYVAIDTVNVTRAATTAQAVEAGKLVIGQGFAGHMDEIRVYDLALDRATFEEDYNRYLVGNETGLILYYGFGEPVEGEVYDSSYGATRHNENHGKVYGNVTEDDVVVPSAAAYAYLEPLSYCGKTDVSGNYRIAGIPYEGDGTQYTLTPYLGVHQFEPNNKTIVIGKATPSFNIDFTDMSSFNVQGYVYYENSTVPVKDVSFYIDGQLAAKSNGEMIVTDETGEFTISVPVGTHEVKASKANHVFVNDGKLVNSFGADLNYQDDMANVRFWDQTTVKVIGKVNGGSVQEARPTGFSLTENNLGDELYIEMELKDYPSEAYDVCTSAEDSVLTEKHYFEDYDNTVTYKRGSVRIDLNKETGEYVAHLYPEAWSITSVFATGYGNLVQDVAENLDLSNSFAEQYSKCDTIPTDSVMYNGMFCYRVDVNPVFECYEVTDSTGATRKAYLGTLSEKQTFYTENGNESVTVYYWDEDSETYNFGAPVYIQGGWYYFMTEAYYPFYYNNDTEGGKLDKVPVTDGTMNYTNTFKSENGSIALNEEGRGVYFFQADNVDVTGANGGMRDLQVSVNVGSLGAGESQTIDGFLLGTKSRGTDFVTDGPNRLLYVLRDPPGSNSYAYLQEGTTFTYERTNIENGWYQEGDNLVEALFGVSLKISTGVGVETITETENQNTLGAVVQHHEEGQDNKTTVDEITTTQTISTSSDPLYVGANGDVLVGYSTNMILSTADDIKIIPSIYKTGTDEVISSFDDYLLCKGSAIAVSEKFETTFAYPQIHIEQVIIPQLEEMIYNYLQFDLTPEQAQAKADAEGQTVYVSKLSEDDPNFGLPNPGTIVPIKGEYYDIYFPKSLPEDKWVDQIDSCYNSIQNWINVLKENEEQKVKAFAQSGTDQAKNYSFQAGSNIEESYEYEHQSLNEHVYSFTAGSGVTTELGIEINGLGTHTVINETAGGSGGHNESSGSGTINNYGFVLAEDGDYDYMTVDVINIAPKDTIFGPDSEIMDIKQTGADMVFRLRGGATACPYEGEEYTKYFEPSQHKLSEGTLQIEQPVIEVSPAEIFNVPSNNPASFTLTMYNESETQSDVWFTLSLVDSSIPDGAKLSIDGVPLSDGRVFLVPYGEVLTKTLEVGIGANAYDYEGMQLVLGSQCQCDPTGFQEVISDTITFSAHFIPTSTEVHFKSPGDNWTLNTECDAIDGEYYLPFTITDYDINWRGFDRIEVQYKPVSESQQWSVLRTFYKNEEDVTDPETEEWINQNITMTANFFGDEDQRYDIRAVSYCEYAPGAMVTYESEVLSGIKDTKRPVQFGSPQPADGILDVDDEVMLTFSEDIADGYLTTNNFEVTAIKNGSAGDHSVSIQFNGTNDNAYTEFDKNLSGKSLTAEMWVMPDDINRAGTFFAHGQGDNVFELGMNASKQLTVKVGTQTYTSTTVDLKQGEWAHVTVSYDSEANNVLAYFNYETVINEANVPTYEGVGTFKFGCDAAGSNHYAGQMHDFRLWDAAVAIDDIKAKSLTVLSGLEPSLMLYYPMNEGLGNELTDKARGNTAIFNGTWATPDGYAVSFGGNSYLRINSGEIPVRDDQNFTLEFWFKANSSNATNQALLANGMADGSDFADAKDLFYIGFDESGELFFRNNKQTVNVDGDYRDGQWHQFALTVDRNALNAQIYMDGQLNTYFKTDSIGGLSGSYIYAGAGHLLTDQSVAGTQMNFFNGLIDDIRLWDSHMTQTEIERNRNIQMRGDELGLMAYYPFEKYITNTANVQELVFSTEDMVAQTTEAELMDGAAQSTDKAPLKSKGTEESILYDFVVNEDALIITLTEPEDRIEKTIVNFAVQRVRDINGNEMEGTIRWSAYIDRNQLRWSESEVRIDKAQYEPMEFEVDLNNVGGSVKTYTIEGLPAWLEADPSSGTLDPKGTEHITFTINEGTNVGNYDEVIYAVGENGVAEPLNLIIKVNGQRPDWTVDPSDYEYSMTVFGQMRFEGIFSADEEDMLAAFAEGKCVGVANSSYDRDQDMWYAFLTIYGNERQSDNLEFRMWDASTGKTYGVDKATLVPQIPFVSGSIVGTAAEPVIFDGEELFYQDITLNAGWNWISFNLSNSTLNDVNATLVNGTWNSGDIIKDNDEKGFASYSSRSHSWVGDGIGFDNTSAYLLYTGNAQTLSTSGYEVDETTTPVQVRGGRWNYIGYLPSVNMTVKEALAGYEASVNDVVKSQSQFAMYSGKTWIGNLTYMEPGKGYMLLRNGDGDVQFHYPSTDGALSNVMKSRAVKDNSYLNTDYADNMTIVATAEGTGYGDRILAYVNGELRGVAESVEAEEALLQFINIAGEEEGIVTFALERDGEIIARSSNNLSFAANSVEGTAEIPFVIDFSGQQRTAVVYPTPFVDELYIDVMAKVGDDIDVRIFNSAGQAVHAEQMTATHDTTIRFTWDGASTAGSVCAAGIYLVQVTVGDHVETFKVEKTNY